MKRWPIIVALVMLASTWGMLRSLPHGEPVLTKKPFAEFPLTIAERWQGKARRLTPHASRCCSDLAVRGVLPEPAHREHISLAEELPARVGLAVRGIGSRARAGPGIGEYHH